MNTTNISFLHPTDVQVLEKLAALNQAQQEAGQLPEGSEKRKEVDMQFCLLYNWLHHVQHIPIYKDDAGFWRLGTQVGRGMR